MAGFDGATDAKERGMEEKKECVRTGYYLEITQRMGEYEQLVDVY